MTAAVARTTSVNAKAGAGKSGGASAADDAAPATKKGGLLSKKLIIIIVAVLALAGGGYEMFLAPKPKPAPPSGGDIVALDPTTLNLADGHYLKIAIGVQLIKGKATSASFTTSQAASLVINEFSDRTVISLSSNLARQRLTADLLKKIEKAYPDEVFDIFLTQFVTQ